MGETTPRKNWRQRTPTVMQMEAVECGAAALSIILAQHGRIVPLEQLRISCGVSRDGSKASNVLKAARSFGLEGKGRRMEPEGVRALGKAAIVFWNFNHFLVVEGFKGDKVFLNDPATGPRVVTTAEFDEGFTGIVLDLEPGDAFEKGGRAPSMLGSIRDRLPGSYRNILFLVLVGLALVIPGLMIPIFTKVFVDEYLIGGMDTWVRPLIVIMITTMLVMIGLQWLQLQVLLRLRTRLSISNSAKFFWHILRLPVSFYNQRSAGEIGTRVAINDSVADVMANDLAMSVLAIITIIFYAGLMLTFDPVLTMVAVVIAILNLLALKAVARKRKDGSQRLLMDQGKLMGTSMNGLVAIESLKASGTETDFFSRWAGHHSKALNAQQTLGASTFLLLAIPPLLTGLNSVLILTFGGLRVIQGALTIGGLMAFQALAASFIGPINNLINVAGNIQQMSGDMRRLDDVLEYPANSLDETKAAPSTESRLEGYLELRDLTFGYSPHEPPLIENFNLRLKPGQRVALVGPSGCGKSTISKLVMGLYELWSGEILFDGSPRERIAHLQLVNSLAMVDQDISMFAGTVRENLTLWDDSIPEARMVQAARDACVHEIIAARANGYESEVSEDGLNFSGGQRQRLEIARALVNDPRIVVLDEATSALDTVTEMTVEANLRRRGCTCLIVAHRLSTIRDCDEIIVLDRGKVAQRGTHEEMKDVDGIYRRLIQTM